MIYLLEYNKGKVVSTEGENIWIVMFHVWQHNDTYRIQGYRVHIGYRDTEIQGYRDTEVLGYRDTEILGYRETYRIRGCRDTNIQGYRDKEIQKYRVQGYRDTGYIRETEIQEYIRETEIQGYI